MSHNCTSICSPAIALVTGKMLSEVLEDVELQGHQLCTLDHNRSACIKGVLIYILHMVC